ncbi:MAG: hypothetical protein ACK4N5_04735, partial [Myxococcales bacterium]
MKMLFPIALVAVVFACFAGACAGPAPAHCTSPPHRARYAASWAQVQEGLDAGRCKLDQRCGALAFVNCGVEVDGAGYYVDAEHECVLEVCGG